MRRRDFITLLGGVRIFRTPWGRAYVRIFRTYGTPVPGLPYGGLEPRRRPGLVKNKKKRAQAAYEKTPPKLADRMPMKSRVLTLLGIETRGFPMKRAVLYLRVSTQ